MNKRNKKNKKYKKTDAEVNTTMLSRERKKNKGETKEENQGENRTPVIIR